MLTSPISELQFMVKTSMNDFHPSDRKLIRSHVMKGKNQGRMRPLGSRRYRELVNARGSIAAPSSSIDESNHTGLSRSKSNNSLLPSEDQTSIQASEPIPPLIGSPVSPMYLADSVNPAMVKVVLQRLSSSCLLTL